MATLSHMIVLTKLFFFLYIFNYFGNLANNKYHSNCCTISHRCVKSPSRMY